MKVPYLRGRSRRRISCERRRKEKGSGMGWEKRRDKLRVEFVEMSFES